MAREIQGSKGRRGGGKRTGWWLYTRVQEGIGGLFWKNQDRWENGNHWKKVAGKDMVLHPLQRSEKESEKKTGR